MNSKIESPKKYNDEMQTPSKLIPNYDHPLSLGAFSNKKNNKLKL